MENNVTVLEHSHMMLYSRELLELKTPKEMNATLITISAFFCFLFISLFCFKINNVIKVQGIVRPANNTSEINNVIAGKITSICYEKNQSVKKGDLLYTIDDSQYKASVAMYREDINNLEKELLCTKAMLAVMYNEMPNTVSEDIYINSKIQSFLENKSLLENQINLYKQQYDFQKSLPASLQNKKTLKECQLQYSLYTQQLEKFLVENKTMALEAEKNLTVKINNLKKELEQLEANNAYLEIKAPVSGIIQEESSLNVGDYIFANQHVLKIIPNDNKDFKIEMYVPTKDIGEISEGMNVNYRLSAFPFFEYKGAEGKIQSIDPDIRQTNNSLLYCVYSDINKTSFQNKNGKSYPLRSGIEVDARIILEKVTLASYIFRKLGFSL